MESAQVQRSGVGHAFHRCVGRPSCFFRACMALRSRCTMFTVFGDELLPIILPIVQQRLQQGDWRLRESGKWCSKEVECSGEGCRPSAPFAVLECPLWTLLPSFVRPAPPLPLFFARSAILALGAISEGCAAGLQPHLPGMVSMLLPTLKDPRPMVRRIRCAHASGRAEALITLRLLTACCPMPVAGHSGATSNGFWSAQRGATAASWMPWWPASWSAASTTTAACRCGCHVLARSAGAAARGAGVLTCKTRRASRWQHVVRWQPSLRRQGHAALRICLPS